MSSGVCRSLWLAGAAATVALASLHIEAHKTITSKYTYNGDVFPILRERCGRCHVDGGPTPMSLMTYKDASPWAESMREHLTAESMPPWFVDPMGPAVRGGHAITTRELDILIAWATGGTPEGDPAKAPAPVAALNQWKAGMPEQLVAMSATHTLPVGTLEETVDLVMPTNLREERWVKAVDLRPGTPSMVRDAVIATDDGVVLGAWAPGHEATPAPNGAAFRLAAGAALHVRMHYKKHWQDEQVEKSDLSIVGLYFTEAPLTGRAIQTVVIESPGADARASQPLTFGGSLMTASRVLALRPRLDQAYASFTIEAVMPNGRRTSLLRLHAAQSQWHHRYWLADPVDLPAGTRVEVTALPEPPADYAPSTTRYPLQVAVDVVPIS